jgi:hypothetical protein
MAELAALRLPSLEVADTTEFFTALAAASGKYRRSAAMNLPKKDLS